MARTGGDGTAALPARVRQQARRVRLDRVAAIAAALAAVVLVLVEGSLAAGSHRIAVPIAFALAAVHAGSLPLALRRPHLAALIALAAATALQVLSEDDAGVWPWWPVLIVTQSLVLAVVASRASWPAAVAQWLLAAAAPLLLVAVLRPAVDPAAPADLVVFAATAAALMVAAALATQWRRVRTALLHEREVSAAESERLAVMEERTRIARELHDVVAHSLSLITVQSSTARFRHAGFSADAAAEFDRIGAQSRQALDEMRGLLRVLRGSDEDPALRPQPGLADLPALVAQSSEAGPRVTLSVPEGEWARGVGPVAALAAYRIVQEATSNAMRHAPGAPVTVLLGRPAGAVEVTVSNAPAASGAPSSGGGHGLVGMLERAASTGGSLRFGPTADGGWQVHAVLPAHPALEAGAS